jgi:predicted extracellular nuclease
MKYFTLILSLTAFIRVNAQSYNIGFYNVENLFDTIDDPHKNDNEFLPNAKKNWNTQKYNEKISHINQVINYVDSPLAFGFCEIENRRVLEDLVSSNTLIENYQIVHYESSDERGIDVGMIYNPEKLQTHSLLFYSLYLTWKRKTFLKRYCMG